MTLPFSIGDEDDTLSATDISACYCPGFQKLLQTSLALPSEWL